METKKSTPIIQYGLGAVLIAITVAWFDWALAWNYLEPIWSIFM
ncbi:MAG: hypothetical protein WDZ93_01660 [Candidatus Paceibacterota bacterium]